MSRGSQENAARALASAGMNVLRTSSSRILGIALVITCAILFVVAFVTGFFAFELASLVSFVLGVALLAVELEPRVRISVASDAVLGHLRAMDDALVILGATGKAAYVRQGDGIKMVMSTAGTDSKIELTPVGDAIYSEIVDQVGDLSQQGFEFFRTQLPRALADNLSMMEEVGISREGDDVKVSMKKPFVRPLCLDPFVNSKVCCKMGCPLAGAVAQSLAVATGKEVNFENCTYDPRTQRALTLLRLGRSE